jgi:sulfatase modifying factor 1
MAKVGRACVDRWEAHLAIVHDDGSRAPHPHHERPAEGVRYLAVSEGGVFPQAYISRVEAKRACKEAGKRLCTRVEWQNACRARPGARYPYGDKGVRTRCNSGKPHLLALKFPGVTRALKYDEHFNDPSLALEPGFLSKTGEYSDCVSTAGAFDLVGNLHEWVSDTVDQAYVDALLAERHERRRQPWHEGNGVFMGGFFSTTSELGPGCEFTTIAHEPAYHDYSTGFRCCRDAPKPPKPARVR